jgi:hypothetical protein
LQLDWLDVPRRQVFMNAVTRRIGTPVRGKRPE